MTAFHNFVSKHWGQSPFLKCHVSCCLSALSTFSACDFMVATGVLGPKLSWPCCCRCEKPRQLMRSRPHRRWDLETHAAWHQISLSVAVLSRFLNHTCSFFCLEMFGLAPKHAWLFCGCPNNQVLETATPIFGSGQTGRLVGHS